MVDGNKELVWSLSGVVRKHNIKPPSEGLLVGSGLHFEAPKPADTYSETGKEERDSRSKRKQATCKRQRLEETNDSEDGMPIILPDLPHLSASNQGKRYLDMFAMITTFQVHPSVVDPGNIDWFLDSKREETDSEPSALELNLTMAVCLGARSCNDKTIEVECWHKAIRQAEALVGENDFHVASALMLMGGYCCVDKTLRDQGIHFASLGATICENLGKQNTSVYIRLITQLHLSSGEGALQDFGKKLETVKTSPCDEEGAQLVYHELTVGTLIAFSRCIAFISHDGQSKSQQSVDWETERQQVMLFRFMWDQMKNSLKDSQRLVMDLILTSLASLVNLSLGCTDKAIQEAFLFLSLLDSPLFNYLHLSPSLAIPPMKVLSMMSGDTDCTSVDKLNTAFYLPRTV